MPTEVLAPLDLRLRRDLYPQLGYTAFPFHAFDEFGNLILPKEVELPEEDKNKLNQALAAAHWKNVYKALSKFGDPDLYNSYSLGLHFSGASLDLLLVKSLGTEEDPKDAGAFCEHIGDGLLITVQEAAGTQWAIDSALALTIRKILAQLAKETPPSNPAPGGGGQETGGGSAGPPAGGTPVTPHDQSDNATLFAGWSPVLGLQLLSTLVEFAASQQVPRHITTTVLWYPPSEWPNERGEDLLDRYQPLDKCKSVFDGRRRIESCIWNASGKEVIGWRNRYYYTEGRPAMHLWPERMNNCLYA